MFSLGVLSLVMHLSLYYLDSTPRLSYLLVLWVTEDGMGLFEQCGEQNCD
jgi:hypothetical protein